MKPMNTKRCRRGVGAGRENGGKKDAISARALGSHQRLPIVRGGEREQAMRGTYASGFAVYAVRAPFERELGGIRQHHEVAGRPRYPGKRAEAGGTLVSSKMVVPEHKARTSRQGA